MLSKCNRCDRVCPVREVATWVVKEKWFELGRSSVSKSLISSEVEQAQAR
jgi:hypothetical protein